MWAVTTPELSDSDATGGAARLCSFSMSNFRLFRRETVEFHRDVTVFVGRNDVGKTSILEALYLYGRMCQKTGFRGPLSDEEFSGHGLFATRFEAVWEVDGARWTHAVTLDAADPREVVSTGDRTWVWNPKARELSFGGRSYPAKYVHRYHALAMLDEKQWELDTEAPAEVVAPLAALRRFVTPMPFLFEPSALSARVPIDMSEPTRAGAAWVLWLQDIINRRDQDVGRVESKLRELFPFFRSASVREDRVQVRRRIIDSATGSVQMTLFPMGRRGAAAPDERSDDEFTSGASGLESYREARFAVADGGDEATGRRTVGAAKVSSGLLLALAHLCLVYAAPRGALLAVEEPENGLNPKITFEMMRAYLDAVQERGQQLILTTHNAWWLDVVPIESIRVVTRDDGGGRVSSPRVEDLQKIAEEQGVYPSEIVSVHGPEGLLRVRERRSVA